MQTRNYIIGELSIKIESTDTLWDGTKALLTLTNKYGEIPKNCKLVLSLNNPLLADLIESIDDQKPAIIFYILLSNAGETGRSIANQIRRTANLPILNVDNVHDSENENKPRIN